MSVGYLRSGATWMAIGGERISKHKAYKAYVGE
jgi:hypothetical protein